MKKGDIVTIDGQEYEVNFVYSFGKIKLEPRSIKVGDTVRYGTDVGYYKVVNIFKYNEEKYYTIVSTVARYNPYFYTVKEGLLKHV